MKLGSIKKFINQYLSEWTEIRHQLHRCAELAWNEYKTTEFIRATAEKWGYVWNSFDLVETGGYIDFIVDPEAHFIGWRADIDALPIPDDESLEYKSLTPGISHACGHDFHTTIGLALAKALKEGLIKPKKNIRILFQPAEEPIPSGAFKLKNEKCIEELSAIFAIHVEPGLPVGTISFAEGWVNAQSSRFEFIFQGEGGHSARPHLTQDLIPIVSDFVLDITNYAKKLEKKNSPIVMVFTTVKGGDSYNSIPREVSLTATLRITRADYLDIIQRYINQKCHTLKETHNVDLEYSSISGAPPVIIKKDIYLSLKQIYNKFLKDELSLAEFRSMGGDDFGWYLQKIPGAIIRIGIQQDSKSKSLHSPGFNVSDEAISSAVLVGCSILSMWD